MKDINWSAEFEVTADGIDTKFWELPELAREAIISAIRGDFFSGTFVTTDDNGNDIDINWSVKFEITQDGVESSFDKLSAPAQETVLEALEGDSYSGTFLD